MKSDNFELDNFLYGLLFITLAFFIFKFNRFWIKKMKSNGEKFYSYDRGPIVYKRILAIYVLALLSVVFFLKAFKLWD